MNEESWNYGEIVKIRTIDKGDANLRRKIENENKWPRGPKPMRKLWKQEETNEESWTYGNRNSVVDISH
jgi:hypothetical protein